MATPPSLSPKILSQLELLKLKSRRSFLGSRQGGHISIKRGHGIEFSDYRQYELGDNPRSIDWGVYARSDKLYVKRFQEEQDLSVFIVLDASASMFFPEEDKKWERAKNIALAISYVALMQQDSVNISVLGAFQSPKYRGGRALHSISRALSELKLPVPPAESKDFVHALSSVRFPGVAFFISDFLYDFASFESQFDLLRAKNLDITAIQVLGDNDIDPLSKIEATSIEDSETGEEFDIALSPQARREYSARLERHNTLIREYLHSSQVAFVSTKATMPFEDFITHELASSAVFR